jgi:hypothetical protein
MGSSQAVQQFVIQRLGADAEAVYAGSEIGFQLVFR